MFVRSGSALLNVVSFGAGPRTLVTHGGWTGTWEVWQQPFEIMSGRWRCVGFDHRGTGATTSGDDPITADRLVSDLMRVLDALEIERCILAGESAGGIVALGAVLAAPDRFDGLVLIDSPPFVTQNDVAALVEGSRSDYAATVDWFVEACVPERDSEHLKRWGRQMLMRSDGETAARLLECLIDITHDLRSLDLPTLVIRGELDAIVAHEAASVLSAGIRGASTHVVPGAGHVPTVTAPLAVVEAIESWAASIAR